MIRPAILTSRLLIRSTTVADTAACLELWLRPEEGRYLSDPPREKASEAYLSWGKDIETQTGWYPMIICLRETGEMIGTCSIVPTEEDSCWDFGYALYKPYWRMGYGTEALRALIDTGHAEGIRHFTIEAATENTASCALARKVGMRPWKYGSFRKTGTDIIYDNCIFRLDD